MAQDSMNKSRGGGLLKKIGSVATAGILAASLTPGLAFASAGSDNGTSWFDLPTARSESFTHTATVNGNQVSYQYMTAGIEKVVGGFSQSLYYLMGINGVNFDRGLRNGNPWDNVSNGRLNVTAVTAVDGIMGTDVNIQPDEYLWNSCVKLSSGTNLAQVDSGASDMKAVHINTSMGRPDPETVPVEINGESFNMPVEIYMEANLISNSSSDWNAADGIAYWVELERNREGGSPDYDPAIATWRTASGGIYDNTTLMYNLADVVDSVTADSKDANGNATLMSRYVDALGTDTTGQKYDSALQFAQRYEDFAKATQYYMIGKINQGLVQKKVTAVVVGYYNDGSEDYYACAIYDPAISGEHANTGAAVYGSRLTNSIMNYSTDINTVLGAEKQAFAPFNGTMANGTVRDDTNKVIWYKASDIVQNADAVFVTDAPGDNTISNYLAVSPDGVCHGVYTADNANYEQTNENVNPLVEASVDTDCDVYYKFPHHIFGVWYAQGFENNWLAPLCASYLYGDSFTSPENVMAYAAANFWHIKSSEIDNVLEATCAGISLPSGANFGTPDADYQAQIDGIMEQGNAYYLSSRGVMAAINAMNSGDLVTCDLAALNERTPEVSIVSNVIGMHRLYNPYTGEHFYTGDVEEWGNLVDAGWNDESIGWIAPERSNTPVYRLYNPYAGEHHYTMSADERDNLVAVGWNNEGIGWYSDDAQSVALFRDYNPNELANNHNYTTSIEEHNTLMRAGWNDEGYAWYGVTPTEE